jgi:ABC-type transporter Mla MlaB component
MVWTGVESPLPEPRIVGCDVSRVTEPDEYALDALARLQLTARRLGATIHLHNANPALAAMIELAGLADVLIIEPGEPIDAMGRAAPTGSGVEVGRQIEEREETRVDEEVHPGDDSA